MYVLAIETSCDETGIALVKAEGNLNAFIKNPKTKIIFNLIQSQIPIHRPFGGVVPNLAKREHILNLPILFSEAEKIMAKKKIPLKKIDLIAVTVGPGLEPALWAGINFAKEVHKKIKKENKDCKMIGVNHLEGHLFSLLFGNRRIQFPSIALIVSGGHTMLLSLKEKMTFWRKIGETRDDAAGECFDKVARLLGLPYPGGPEIEARAKIGNKEFVDFPRPMIGQKNYDFSFSGLKTAILYFLRDLQTTEKMTDAKINDIAASFQEAAFDVLSKKTLKAAQEFKAKSILVAGGVANNKALSDSIKKAVKKFPLPPAKIFLPPRGLSGDNAAMIALAGYVNFLKKKKRVFKANSTMTI